MCVGGGTIADYVYDTLAIESGNNLSLPDWTSRYFPGGKFKVRPQAR